MKTSIKFLLFVPIAIAVALIAWYYYGTGEEEKRLTPQEAERLFAVLHRLTLWRKILGQQLFAERKNFLVGTNINLDLIVPFEEFIKGYDPSVAPSTPESLDVVNSLEDFFSTLSFYLNRGAAAERFVSHGDVFKNLTAVAESVPHRLNIGGNAALMADFLSHIQHIDVKLFGPVGHKLRPLMSPRLFSELVEAESDQPDEIHLIIEYKAGETFGQSKAPIANRFIVHHDISNMQLIHVKGFLEAVINDDNNLHWAVWSGLHFLDSLAAHEYRPHIDLFESYLKNRNGIAPLHMELASMANAEFVKELFQRVVIHADSIGLNDQEINFLSKSLGGPELKANGIIDKISAILVWILKYARDLSGNERHLSRIHMHSHRIHIIAQSSSSKWKGTPEGLLHGGLVAAIRACGSEEATRFELSRPKFANGTVLPHFDDRHPVITWLEEDIELFVLPTILCRKPVGTVGLGDAISAAALVFNGISK